MIRLFLICVFGLCLFASTALAQVESPAADGVTLGEKQTQKWQVGVIIRAVGPCVGVYATVPVPTDWPEQTVRIVEEETTPHVRRIDYRELDGGVKQMIVNIPQIAAGDEAKALLTLEVTRRYLVEPADPNQFVFAKRPPRDVLKMTGPSPYIESRHADITRLARKLVDEKEQQNATAWQTVESIYDWVRENVEYRNGDLKGALAALRDGNGDCEELTSLFIALCRANKIPARTVWIPGHCYPEFYLDDAEGNGHWFPCQAAGTRAFGSMPEFRPVLQKGDNFKVPEKTAPQRYVAEFCKMKSVAGAKPQVIFVQEYLGDVD